LKGSESKPEDATKAILAAFDKCEVVGMNARHSKKDLGNFILDLVRNPGLAGKINDVAVECGNSLYQPIYIAGEDVPIEKVRQVSRNTPLPICDTSGIYEELVPLVRKTN
jgi:hypothetical protein